MQQMRILEDAVTRMRNLIAEVTIMKGKFCLMRLRSFVFDFRWQSPGLVLETSTELELSMSVLHNPEIMLKLSNVDSVSRETETLLNSLQENEQGPTIEIKIECCDSEKDQATYESDNLLADSESAVDIDIVVPDESSQ